MESHDKDYLADRKYIHETLDHTRKYTEKLDSKFEQFKVDVTKDIAVIQTKLAMYVALGSVVTGIIVNVAIKMLGAK